MTVVALRSMAKEKGVKLSAGIDKAGIIEKLSSVLHQDEEHVSEMALPSSRTETECAEQPKSTNSDFDPLSASADVTSATPSYRRLVSQQVESRSNYQNTGWQNRSALREQQAIRTGSAWQQRTQAANHRFGPQSRKNDNLEKSAEISSEPASSVQATPQVPASPVSVDGYRLGYRAAPQRQGYAPKERGDYDGLSGNRSYQQRAGYTSQYQEDHGYQRMDSSNSGLSDNVYRMTHSAEFENQRLQGVIPTLLQPMETVSAGGILEIMPDGFGFLRSNSLTPSKTDIYMAPAINRRYNLRTGDVIQGKARKQRTIDKYSAMLTLDTINGQIADENMVRPVFDQLIATYPTTRISLEGGSNQKDDTVLRLVDFIAPIGYGQRGLISAPANSGALQLLTDMCRVIEQNDPDTEVLMLVIDAAPEEITEIRESVNARVFSSTYTDSPDNQTRICETMLEYAERLVENGKNVIILLDSLTKLTKAYQASLYQGTRPMSNTIAPAALVKPKRFFGSARNIRDGGSLTVIATISIETGNRIDEIIYEEFKGTANMDLVLCTPANGDPIFPMIQLSGSGTKKDALLLNDMQKEALEGLRAILGTMDNQKAVKQIIEVMLKTKNNDDFMNRIIHWLCMLEKAPQGK